MAKKTDPNRIQLMDTTLRDGEQTPGISYTPEEKLQLARLLLREVGVDRIEVASTRVSEGEREAARQITRWARRASRLGSIEMLAYCDGKTSVDWIADVGGRAMNLLCKGSELHCRKQLRLSPEAHRKQIAETVRHARRRRFTVNAYLEDWSDGVRDSFDYVYAITEQLRNLAVNRIYLADTLGIFDPEAVSRYVGLMTATWPDLTFEFHGHNDYGLATANCMAAVHAGARGVHTSVNGLGERAGNARLAEVVAALHDHSNFRTGVKETRLVTASRVVETFSGKEMPANAPIVGRDVFTQTAGIHADGDSKGDLYVSGLTPQRFGQRRRYALGKLSGKASLDHNLKNLGIDLPAADRGLVLNRIVELGDKKHLVVPEDLPYIIADVLKTPSEQRVKIESYRVAVTSDQSPSADVRVAYRGRSVEATAGGDGGYDALMNALKKALRSFKIEVPRLADYRVRIPPGGRTAALVETLITWEDPGKASGTFSTQGVDPDQMAAAVIATEKMLNLLVTPGKRSAAASK